MEESAVILVLRVFVGLKWIIEESISLCLYQSIRTIKHRIVKAILL